MSDIFLAPLMNIKISSTKKNWQKNVATMFTNLIFYTCER